MREVFVLIAGAVFATLIGASLAVAQEEVTIDDVKAEFGGLTRSEIEAMGYVVEPVCVDASELPPPILELLGASPTDGMGFHAGNEALFDDVVDPLEPELILLDADDNVIAVEYEANIDTEEPSVLGQPMNLLPGGHPGMEFDHYVLHAWFIDNPNGQFADFNPNVSCPAAPSAAPVTGSGGYLTSDGSGGALPLLPLLAGSAGVAFVVAGWALRRRLSR